jgi:hypothetical protein
MFGARPHTKVPTTNPVSPAVSGGTGPLRSAHPPDAAVANRAAAVIAVEPQAYNASPSRSRAALGIAVMTPIASNAMIDMTAMTPMVRTRCSGPKMLPYESARESAGESGADITPA